MRGADVDVTAPFALLESLMKDWTNTPGAPELIPFHDKRFTIRYCTCRGHAAARFNVTLLLVERLG
jgi:hypothetical protein